MADKFVGSIDSFYRIIWGGKGQKKGQNQG